jgi:hypothetical protein
MPTYMLVNGKLTFITEQLKKYIKIIPNSAYIFNGMESTKHFHLK